MRLTLRLFGLEVLHFEAATEEADEDTARDLSGGTLASTPMGFVARVDWGGDDEVE